MSSPAGERLCVELNRPVAVEQHAQQQQQCCDDERVQQRLAIRGICLVQLVQVVGVVDVLQQLHVVLGRRGVLVARDLGQAVRQPTLLLLLR